MEIFNRKAKYDYQIIEAFEVGIVLTGTEIKSIRKGSAALKDAYGIIKNGELFLLNMYIAPLEEGSSNNHSETRTRKLLMHKKEVLKLDKEVQLNGFTLVPLKLYFKHNIAKIELVLCRGKKNYDKRETIKQRDLEREASKNR